MKRSLVIVICLLLLSFNLSFASELNKDSSHAPDKNTIEYKQSITNHLQKLSKVFEPMDVKGKILPITVFAQERDYWCGPAAIKMALHTKNGSSPSQTSIASNAGTDVNGTLVYRVRDTLNYYSSSYQYYSANQVPFFDTVYQSLLTNRPVIYNLKTNLLPNHNGNSYYHYITGYGVYRNLSISTMYYADSWPYNGALGTWSTSESIMYQSIMNNNGYFIAD